LPNAEDSGIFYKASIVERHQVNELGPKKKIFGRENTTNADIAEKYQYKSKFFMILMQSIVHFHKWKDRQFLGMKQSSRYIINKDRHIHAS